MSNAVDQELLDKIYHQYTRLSSVALPAFNAEEYTGDDMLDKYKMYLKKLSKDYLEEIVCKPRCDDYTCPRCDGWGRSDYEAFLERLATKSA
jgi:hypothetical protein